MIVIYAFQEYWSVRIFERFRNMRKRRDRSIQMVVSKRTKPLTPSKKESKMSYGFDNYLPKKPVSEDDESLKRNIHLLNKEMQRHHQDPSTIEHLMTLTLFDRRQKIVIDHCPLEKIHELYPILFNCNQVTISMYSVFILNSVELIYVQLFYIMDVTSH